jgi:23S rRNA-/tRNA-specific pseudouridylate synthase
MRLYAVGRKTREPLIFPSTKSLHSQDFKKIAQTELELNRRYSLLRLYPENGRYHQIRRHLRNIGAPIVGDFRHGHKEKNLIHQEKTGKKLRLMLQCYRLVFSHQGKIYRFKLPSEL